LLKVKGKTKGKWSLPQVTISCQCKQKLAYDQNCHKMLWKLAYEKQS
jgi:hypothetical protein